VAPFDSQGLHFHRLVNFKFDAKNSQFLEDQVRKNILISYHITRHKIQYSAENETSEQVDSQ